MAMIYLIIRQKCMLHLSTMGECSQAQPQLSRPVSQLAVAAAAIAAS